MLRLVYGAITGKVRVCKSLIRKLVVVRVAAARLVQVVF